MLSAITPKVPITVVANQGIAGMATTVQVGACKVLSNIIYLGSTILAESPLQPTLFFSTRVSDDQRYLSRSRLYACINTRKFKGLDSKEITSLPDIKKMIYMALHFDHRRK